MTTYEIYRELEENIHKTAESINRLAELDSKEKESLIQGIRYIMEPDLYTIESFLELIKDMQDYKTTCDDDCEEDYYDEDEDEYLDDPDSYGKLIDQDRKFDEALIEGENEKVLGATYFSEELMKKYEKVKFRAGGKPSKLDKESVLKLACYCTVVLSEFGGKIELDTMLNYLQSYDLGILHRDLTRGNLLDFISGHSYQRITKDFFHRNGKIIYIN